MKKHSPSCDRNREPIANVLADRLPAEGTFLEVASGTGQHIAFLAARFPDMTFLPTDRTSEDFMSIEAWCDGLSNVHPPQVLDVLSAREIPDANFVLNCNMIHITPPETLDNLMKVSQASLSSGGVLGLYGPFKIDGQHTADSNVAFEKWLKKLDPRFGVRDLDDVVQAANAHELQFVERVNMPANNSMIFFQHR